VQSIRLTYTVDHAHNDYIELAAELGLPCAAMLFAILFWLPIQFARASLNARSSLTRSLALGALGGSAALLVHSIADFNLYIPGNALVFAVILGLGYSGVAEMRSENVRDDEASRETVAYQGSAVRLKSSSQTVPAI
jgi:O-antigen ligase